VENKKDKSASPPTSDSAKSSMPPCESSPRKGLGRHFATMDAIADAVIDRMEAILFEGFPPDDPDPLKRLESFFKNRVRVILEYQHISRMLLSDHLKQTAGSERARRVEEFKVRSRDFVRECLTSAREKGLLIAAGPEESSVLVLGAIFTLAHAGTRPGGNEKLKQLSKRVWSLLERMFRDGEHRLGSTR
jgi:AcrR family transcriptional regulator